MTEEAVTEDEATTSEDVIETTEDETSNSKNEAPATGDSTIALFALLAVLSGATLFTIKKKNA